VAVIENVFAAAFTFPVAWAIDFMPSHEIMPFASPFESTVMCQSSAGQPAIAFD
jgi:hypothetical protein